MTVEHEKDETTQRIHLPARAKARRWPHLLVVDGPQRGEIFRLSRPQTIIGRSADADVCLESPAVSRRHAMLTILGDRVVIEDLRSFNGTYVGVEKIRGQRDLIDGCVITVGDVTLVELTYSTALDEAVRRVSYVQATATVERRHRILGTSSTVFEPSWATRVGTGQVCRCSSRGLDSRDRRSPQKRTLI